MSEAAPPAREPVAGPAPPGAAAPSTEGQPALPAPAASAAPEAAPAADAPPAAAAARSAPTPFWLCVPRTLRMPLQPAPLLNNAVATVVFACAALILYASALDAPARTALTLALAWLATTLFLARFCLQAVELTAAGYLDSRNYPKGPASFDWRQPAKLGGLLGVAPLIAALLDLLHAPAIVGLAVMLIYALALPAALMLISTNDNLPNALQPARLAETALKLGAPYLLLCVLPFLLCVFVTWAADALAQLGPGYVPPPADAAASAAPAVSGSPVRFVLAALGFAAAGNYLLELACAQVGYAMFQFSDALGVAVVGPGEARARGPTSAAAHERRMREAMVARLVASGELNEAAELIREDMRARPNDLSLHARLHDVLLREGARPRIEEHADRYLELLLTAGNAREALALFEQTRDRFPGFAPREAANLPRLAGAAIDELKPELATELIRGFDRKYPGHPAVPDVYVLGARVLLQSRRDDEARRLLNYVVANFAATGAAAEARRYLQRFDKP